MGIKTTKGISNTLNTIKPIIDEFEKDVYEKDNKPISKARCIALIKQLRDLGI